MAGYYGYSMSNNAVDAYENGRFPASKIGRGIPVKLIREHCGEGEYHHTSKHYNVTYFYDKAEVLAMFGIEECNEYPFEYCLCDEAVADLKKYKEDKKAKKNEKQIVEMVSGYFKVWEGRGRRGSFCKYEFKNCEKKGNWIYTKHGKKKADGLHLFYTVDKR